VLNNIVKIIIILVLSSALTATADSWTVESGLISNSEINRLRQRHNQITTPHQLQQLLTDFGRRFPTLTLEAERINGAWVLKGKRATIIYDLDIQIATRFLKIPLLALTQGYIGEVDSLEIRTKIINAIKSYLKNRGFPLSIIKVERNTTPEGAYYLILVKQGEPCLIENVEIGFTVPDDMKIDLERGDICDSEIIDAAIIDLEVSFREKGYNQLKIELADIAINKRTNYATIYIAGILGQRIKYRINDTSQKIIIGDLFQDEELTEIDPSIVGPDAMTAELIRRYKSHGYLDVKVSTPTVQKTSNDEFIYTYNVTPGTQYILSSLQFDGASLFTNEELLEIMGLSSLWQASRPLNMEEIETGLASLRVAYQEQGYWDAQVRDPGGGQRNRSTGTVRFVISIKEGLPRLLNNITVEGATFKKTSEIRALLNTKKGAALDRAKLVDLDREVRAAYLANGYLYAKVKIGLAAREENNRIPTDVILTIDEGPRVKVGDISIVGLVKTNSKVVKRELLFEQGDWYDPEAVVLSRRNLTRLGIFSSVKISPADRQAVTNKAKELNLVVEIREGKAGAVTFGPGWNLISGFLYDTEASYANIGGVGRRLSLKAAISEERHQPAIGPRTLLGRSVGAGFLEPYIFDTPISSGISVRHRAEAFNNYWKLSNEGELNFRYKLKSILPGSTATVFYGQEVSRTEGGYQSEDDLATMALVRIGQIGLRYNIDESNSKEFPSAGFTFDLEYAHANYSLGGNLKFDRIEFRHNYFIGLIDNLVLALSVGVTSYTNIETSNDEPDVLPTSERLQLGGMTASVRGYKPLRIGPAARVPTYDTNNEWDCGHKFVDIGGSNRTVFNTELRYKFTDTFAGTGFVDSGTTFFSKEQAQQFKTAFQDDITGPAGSTCEGATTQRTLEENVGYEYSELMQNPDYIWDRHYISYGTAFNILTPIGSLNLAYGLPLRQPASSRCSEDSICYDHGVNDESYWLFRGNFHFSVGAKF
jgi:outer membrane protein assembly complex protein YaeT